MSEGGGGDKGDNPWKALEIRNGLLTVICSWMQAASADRIREILLRSVKMEEFEAAKEAIKASIPILELAEVFPRANKDFYTKRRSADKNIEDIMEFLQVLDEKNRIPLFLAASNELVKFNKIVLLDTEPQVVGPRLVRLEERMDQIYSILQGNLEKRDDVQILPTLNGINNKVDAFLREQRSYAAAASKGTETSIPQRAASFKRGLPNQKEAPSKRRRTETGSVSETAADSGAAFVATGADDDVFQIVQKKEKKKKLQSASGKLQHRKMKPVIWGKAKVQSEAAMAAPFDIYVCNTHHTTTEEGIRKTLQDNTSGDAGSGVQALEVVCQSKEGMFKKSWRIRVNFADKDRALEPETWPEGWGIRKFFYPRKKLLSAAKSISHPAPGGISE